jgi:2Fe-2S ferredoxin
MPLPFVTTPKGDTHELQADTGITAMVAIRDAGYEGLLALCGGVCSFATCHLPRARRAGMRRHAGGDQ